MQTVQTLHRNLRLAFWNANRLRRDKYLISNFLDEENIDILMVNETHFTSETRLTLYGYNVYRNDKGSHSGGTAIIIKSGIHHKIIESPLLLILKEHS